MTTADIHGDAWVARLRAEHGRLGARCPCSHPCKACDAGHRPATLPNHPDGRPCMGATCGTACPAAAR